MIPQLMKRLARTALLLIMAGLLLPRTANAQPVVDNSLSHAIGAPSPSSGPTAYSPFLNLPPGLYKYTYSVTGGNFLSNIFLLVNFNAWTPGGPVLLTSPSTPLLFNFYVPPSIPVCSYETIHLIFKSVGSFSITVGQFDLTVVVTENAGPKNLTFVNGVSRAYYAGTDSKIHSMTWTGNNWSYAAINPLSNWGAVQVDGQMTAFADGSRIFFKGKDNKLYNLVQSGLNWTLSQVLPGLPDVSGAVAARNNNEVVFFGSDGQIHQLLFNGTTWTNQIVLPQGGWGSAGQPDGKSINLPIGSTRIFFAGLSGALFNVNLNNGSWVLEQVAPPNLPWAYRYDGSLLAVEDYAVYYKGLDRFIHRFTKCGPSWTLDAMPVAGDSEANVIASGAALTKFPGEDRVFYKSATGRIYNLYSQYGIWYNYPLDTSMVGAAGDLVAAEGKIFYIHHDKRVHNFYWSGSTWSDDPLSTATQADTKACIAPYYY
jgi:hypothetical protein